MKLSAFFKEERLFLPSEVVEERKYITDYLAKYANGSVLIVSGELSGETYESPMFILATKAFVSRGAILEIIAGKPRERLSKENPTLFKMAKEEKERIKIYLCKERPVHHFVVCDGKTLLVQAVHDPGEDAETYFVEDEPEIGERYVRKFRKLVEVCEEVIGEEA